MDRPLVRNIWNTNITPESTITTQLLVKYGNDTSLVFTQGSIYSQPGTYTFTLNLLIYMGKIIFRSYKCFGNLGHVPVWNTNSHFLFRCGTFCICIFVKVHQDCCAILYPIWSVRMLSYIYRYW